MAIQVSKERIHKKVVIGVSVTHGKIIIIVTDRNNLKKLYKQLTTYFIMMIYDLLMYLYKKMSNFRHKTV